MQTNTLPKISCFSTVFGRVNCLEESIQCFLDQDYPGEKELLILNDFTEQTLLFDHPEVRVINHPTRFPSLGEKCNYAVRQTNGPIIVVWEDDDFYFPNHLSVVHKLCTQQNNLQLTQSRNKLAWRGDTLFKIHSCILCGRHFYRDAFEGVGGYPEVTRKHDLGLAWKIAHKYGTSSIIECDPEDSTFIHSSKYEHFHISKRWFRIDANYPGDHDGYRKGYDVTMDNMRKGIIPSGIVHLNPHYNPKYNYLELRRKAIEEEKERLWVELIKTRTATLPDMVSCICPVYGRIQRLEESIECFLRQDYIGKKELIIVNDLADQTLVFDHPEVTIYNLKTRFGTLGEKNNWGVRHSRGSVCMRWDDDDIILPHHISTVIPHMEGNTILRFNGCLCHAPDSDRKIITVFGRARMQGQFTREAFEAVGGHDHVTWGDDSSIVRKIKRKFGVKYVPLALDEKSFVWNLSKKYDWHVTDTSAEAAWDNIEKIQKERIESGKLRTGLVALDPHWRYDYCKQFNNFLLNTLTFPANTDKYLKEKPHAKYMRRNYTPRPNPVRDRLLRFSKEWSR